MADELDLFLEPDARPALAHGERGDQVSRLVEGAAIRARTPALRKGSIHSGVGIDVVQDVGDVLLEAAPDLGAVVGEARAPGERRRAPGVGRRSLEGIAVRFDVGVGAAVDVQVLRQEASGDGHDLLGNGEGPYGFVEGEQEAVAGFHLRHGRHFRVIGRTS
jgi:hypothetical protein